MNNTLHHKSRRFLLGIILLIIVFSSDPFVLHSQTLEKNLERYWFYRDRLKEHFMVCDDNNAQGTNLPATRRYEQGGETILRWGDAETHLGMYISVLATEYKLLKDNHQDYSETLRELRNALLAFERLDRDAEYWWRTPNHHILTPDINGFFIRDDVESSSTDPDFLVNHPNSKLAASGITKIESDFRSADDGGKPCEMSQDQMWHMLPALALVESLVDEPNYLNVDIKGDTLTFKEWSRKITFRTVRWMQAIAFPTDWDIYNPVTMDLVRRGADLDMGVLTYNARFSYAFAAAGNRITKLQGYNNLHYNGSDDVFRRSQFLTLSSLTGCEVPGWLGGLGVDDPRYASFAYRGLIAIDGLEEKITEPIFCGSQEQHAYFEWLLEMHNLTGLFEQFILLYGVLHDFPIDSLTGKPYVHYNNKQWINAYRSLLDIAPDCGPYNFDGLEPETWPILEWSSYNRLIWPQRIGHSQGKIGYYNGLDYMFLHNLYCLSYLNFSDSINNLIGDTNFRCTDLVSGIQLENGQEAEFIADRRISLKPGFHAKPGSSLKAKIDSSQFFSYQRVPYSIQCNFNQSALVTKIASSVLTNDTIRNLIQVYPNPSKGKIVVDCSSLGSDESVDVTITNSLGEIITNLTLSSSKPQSIDFSEHAPGVYLARFSNFNIQVNKLVIIQ